jgi:hypothetical protein
MLHQYKKQNYEDKLRAVLITLQVQLSFVLHICTSSYTQIDYKLHEFPCKPNNLLCLENAWPIS